MRKLLMLASAGMTVAVVLALLSGRDDIRRILRMPDM